MFPWAFSVLKFRPSPRSPPCSDFLQDIRAIIVGVLLFVSVFQYMNDALRYHQVSPWCEHTPAYVPSMCEHY